MTTPKSGENRHFNSVPAQAALAAAILRAVDLVQRMADALPARKRQQSRDSSQELQPFGNGKVNGAIATASDAADGARYGHADAVQSVWARVTNAPRLRVQ